MIFYELYRNRYTRRAWSKYRGLVVTYTSYTISRVARERKNAMTNEERTEIMQKEAEREGLIGTLYELSYTSAHLSNVASSLGMLEGMIQDGATTIQIDTRRQLYMGKLIHEAVRVQMLFDELLYLLRFLKTAS